MSANIRQCKQCNALFQSFGANICPICAEKLDREFIQVKHYLYDHPDANIMDIARDTGIEERTILGFLREGRLSVDSNAGIQRCEECGTPISSGRYCNRCQLVVESLLNAASKIKARRSAERNSAARTGKMHMDYGKRGLIRGDK
ncbi:MAG: hypothetical protein ACOYIR_04900 [Christensenellales bacterium]|jgi:predicted amidophosphoribosyltransferase